MEKCAHIARRIRRRLTFYDSGFTVIELVVALAIFSIVMTSFTYGLQLALGVGRDNRLRTQASQLAARELEIIRNEFTSSDDAPAEIGATSQVMNPHPLSGQNQGQPLKVDGTDFDVARTVQWLPAGTGASPCDGNNPEVTYPSLAVNVTVRWSEGSNTRQVENNTVLTPPKNTVSGSLGFVAAKVVGADGKGVPDVPVTLSGPGGTQRRVTVIDAEDPGGARSGGCAVFAVATPGTYSVTLNESGYVSYDGHQSTSKSAVVAPGKVLVTPFSYDRAATLDVERITADGWMLPTSARGVPVTLFNTSMPPSGTMAVAGSTTQVTNLWPYPDGYSGWSGDCAANDPAMSGATRLPPVPVEPGHSATIHVPLTPMTVTEVDSDGDPRVGRTVLALMVDPTTSSITCGPFTLGVTDDAGQVKSSLPAGTWVIRDSQDAYCSTRSAEDPCLVTPQLTGSLTPVPITLVWGG